MLTGNLEKIAEHGRRADGIVKSMLEHSRGGTGERREVDLNSLVEEALNLAYHGARAQDQNFNITLERDFAPAIAPIELVPQDITRVSAQPVRQRLLRRHQAPAGGTPTGVQPDPEGGDARSRRCGRNPRPRQRRRHPARDQGQAVSAVLHYQADRRRAPGSGSRSARTSSPSSMAARSRSTAGSASSPSSQSACRAAAGGDSRDGSLTASTRLLRFARNDEKGRVIARSAATKQSRR